MKHKNSCDENIFMIDKKELRTELFQFRQDFKSPIVAIEPMDTKALAVVQCEDGSIVVYDAEAGELLGKLVTATDIPKRMIKRNINV